MDVDKFRKEERAEKAYELYKEGFRPEVIADYLNVRPNTVLEYIRCKRAEYEPAAITLPKPIKTTGVTRRKGRFVHCAVVAEIPLQEKGTYLSSPEGEAALKRVNTPYEPVLPEAYRIARNAPQDAAQLSSRKGGV